MIHRHCLCYFGPSQKVRHLHRSDASLGSTGFETPGNPDSSTPLDLVRKPSTALPHGPDDVESVIASTHTPEGTDSGDIYSVAILRSQAQLTRYFGRIVETTPASYIR